VEKMLPSDLDPIGVFLVSSGTRGDRLLFRYPFELPIATESLPECERHHIYPLFYLRGQGVLLGLVISIAVEALIC